VQPLLGFCSGERLGVFAVVLCCSCFEFGSVWSSVRLFGVLELSGWERSYLCVASVWPVWSLSMEVGKFHQQGPVWPVVLTSLIGVGQWFRGLVFRCVLGSEGCVLVPRSSGTPVATWAWPIWVVSRRRVLEVVFILLELLSPSGRTFIGSHSLPSLSGSPFWSFKWYQSRFGSLLTLTSLRSKDGVPGTGFGSSTLWW
jgi:hypothetical protein